MDCPRCHTRMYHAVTTLGANSLERCAESNIVKGYSCYNCGEWINDEIQAVMPIPEKEKFKQWTPTQHRVEAGQKNHERMMEFIEVIKEKKQQGNSWSSISAYLSNKGFNISRSALVSHYFQIVEPDLVPGPARNRRRKETPVSCAL